MSITPDRLFKQVGSRYHENEFILGDGEISEGELERFQDRLIRNTYGRTGLSMDRIEYLLDRRQMKKRSELAGPKSIKLSLISSRLPIDESKSWLTTREFEDSRRILMASSHYHRETWCDHRYQELMCALDFEPDVICFPEFAYPPPAQGRTYQEAGEITAPISTDIEIKNDYIDRTSYGRNRTQYENEIRRRIEEKGQPFLFLGSYHCLFDFYNMGVIFPIGHEVTPFMAKIRSSVIDDDGEESTDDSVIAPPMLYRKRFPARRVGEYARIPSNFEFHTYRVDGLHIAVMICSDALDLNQFFNLARINIAGDIREKVDLILIPAFNKSPKLVSMCRELSFLTRSIVAFVNANHDSQKFPDSQLFIGGFTPEELEKLDDRAQGIVSKPSATRVPIMKLQGDSRVLNFEVDLEIADKFYDRLHKLERTGPLGGSGRSGAVYGPRTS